MRRFSAFLSLEMTPFFSVFPVFDLSFPPLFGDVLCAASFFGRGTSASGTAKLSPALLSPLADRATEQGFFPSPSGSDSPFWVCLVGFSRLPRRLEPDARSSAAFWRAHLFSPLTFNSKGRAPSVTRAFFSRRRFYECLFPADARILFSAITRPGITLP